MQVGRILPKECHVQHQKLIAETHGYPTLVLPSFSLLLSSVSPMPLIRFDARSNFIDVRDERKFIIYEKYPFLSSFPLSWVFKNLLEF